MATGKTPWCGLARSPSNEPFSRDRGIRWSSAAVATLLASRGFDPANPSADPRPWLNVQSHQNDAHDHDHHGNDHAHDASRSTISKAEELSIRAHARASSDARGGAVPAGRDRAEPGRGTSARQRESVNVAEEPGRPAANSRGEQHLLHTVLTWLQRWPDSDRRTRLVFITQGIPRAGLKDIIELLDRVSSRTFKARARGRKRWERHREPPLRSNEAQGVLPCGGPFMKKSMGLGGVGHRHGDGGAGRCLPGLSVVGASN